MPARPSPRPEMQTDGLPSHRSSESRARWRSWLGLQGPGLLLAVTFAGACLDTGTAVGGGDPVDFDTLEREPPDAVVEVQGFPPMDTVPNIVASVVAAPRPADARVRRFFDDLGASRIELVLSLADLNPERSNDPFEDPSWRRMVTSEHSVGGTVLLRLADVPRRLRAEDAGVAGPLSGPDARAEWEEIVREVVEHFARRPETRIDELAGPRTPDREEVWGGSAEGSEARGRSFSEHWIRTATAARDVDRDLGISGPGATVDGGDDAWWEGALEPVDDAPRPGFFSIALPGPDFGPAWDEGVERARSRLDAHGLSDAPILVSAWGLDRDTLPGTLARSRVEASHLVAGFIRLTKSGLRHTLGRGPTRTAPVLAADGPGLFLEEGGEVLPTPTYNAMRMIEMAEVGGLLRTEVTDPEVAALAGVDAADRVNLVVTRYRPLETTGSGGRFAEQDLSDVRTVRLHVDRLPFAGPAIELVWIDERRGNVRKGGADRAELDAEVKRRQVGPWVTLDLRMPIYSVVLMRLTP